MPNKQPVTVHTYLIVNSRGALRTNKTGTGLKPDEIAILVKLAVPARLFERPPAGRPDRAARRGGPRGDAGDRGRADGPGGGGAARGVGRGCAGRADRGDLAGAAVMEIAITFGDSTLPRDAVPPDVRAFLDETPALVRRFLDELEPPDPATQRALPGVPRRRRSRPRLLSERRRVLRALCANALPWLPGGEERRRSDDALDEHDVRMARWALDAARREGAKLLAGVPPDRLWDAWGELGPAVRRRMDEAALRQVLVSTLDDDGGTEVWGRWGDDDDAA